jgi:hypothetical protein
MLHDGARCRLEVLDRHEQVFVKLDNWWRRWRRRRRRS